jgi:hypothetical protein
VPFLDIIPLDSRILGDKKQLGAVDVERLVPFIPFVSGFQRHHSTVNALDSRFANDDCHDRRAGSLQNLALSQCLDCEKFLKFFLALSLLFGKIYSTMD